MFDCLVIGGMLTGNPVSAIHGPKHSLLEGKTPVLMADDARELIPSINTSSLVGHYIFANLKKEKIRRKKYRM